MYQSPDYVNAPHHAVPTAGVIRRPRHLDWRLAGAYVVGAVGMGVAIVCLLVLSSFRNVYDGQMTQMRQAVAHEQSVSAQNYQNLNSQYTGMAGVLSAIEAYNMTCSQYLTGPGGGPSTFYFPCRMKAGS